MSWTNGPACASRNFCWKCRHAGCIGSDFRRRTAGTVSLFDCPHGQTGGTRPPELAVPKGDCGGCGREKPIGEITATPEATEAFLRGE